jgi:hypothetical protein
VTVKYRRADYRPKTQIVNSWERGVAKRFSTSVNTWASNYNGFVHVCINFYCSQERTFLRLLFVVFSFIIQWTCFINVGVYSGVYGGNILRPIVKIVLEKSLISEPALAVISHFLLILIRLLARCHLEVIAKLGVLRYLMVVTSSLIMIFSKACGQLSRYKFLYINTSL